MVLVRDLKPSDFTDIEDYYYRFYDEIKENQRPNGLTQVP
jgi:hypothetical protein